MTDQEIANEYAWEYGKQKSWASDAFPTLEHFKKAVRSGWVVQINPEMDKNIDYRSRCSTLGQLQSLVASYKHPRDVNRIVGGIQQDEPIPHPIVLKQNGKYRIMSGNTRMDAAFILGHNPEVLVVDVPQRGSVMKKSTKEEHIEGGKGSKQPDESFEPGKLARNTLKEMVHTKSVGVAKKVAKDHLSEEQGKSIKSKIKAKATTSLEKAKKADKFERCVRDVKSKSTERGGPNPWAVCHASLNKSEELEKSWTEDDLRDMVREAKIDERLEKGDVVDIRSRLKKKISPQSSPADNLVAHFNRIKDSIARIQSMTNQLSVVPPSGDVPEGHKRSLFSDRPNPLNVVFTHGDDQSASGLHHTAVDVDPRQLAHGSDESLAAYLNRHGLVNDAIGRGHNSIIIHVKGEKK
jgi:hypothetical protein